MPKSVTPNRVTFLRKPCLLLLVLVAVISGGVSSFLLQAKSATAATSSTINFQARLLTGAGNLVPDGNYNVEFKIYDALTSSGSSQGSCSGDSHCLWAETRTTTNQVRVANGYLTVNLGSVTSLPSINWDQQMWLSMNIGGTAVSPVWDGEMSPRLQLTAVPYAFRAGQLATNNGGNVATLGFTAPTAARSILLPDESGTVCLQNASTCGFASSSGSGNYIQNTTSAQAANFNVQAASSGSVAGKLQANASGSGDILDLINGSGVTVGTFSSTGAVTLKTTTNSTTGFVVQNSGGGGVLTVDTSGTRVLVGSSSICTSGRFCVGYSDTGTGSATVTNSNNVIQINTTGIDTDIGQKITLNDISSGIANTVQGLLVDSTGSTNTSANITSILAKTNSANPGNLIQLTSGSTDVTTISNTGAATFKNQANSTSAFQVQNASGEALLGVDTTGNSANVVSNPSFEVDTSGWNQRTGCTKSRVTSPVLFGAGAMRCTNTATAGAGTNYPTGSLTATTYTLSFYAKAAGTFSTFAFGYSPDGVDETTNLRTAQTVNSTGWTRYTISFTGSTNGAGYLFFKQTDSASGHDFFIDGVQLETGSTATAYQDGKLTLTGAVSSSLILQGSDNSSTAFAVYTSSGGQALNVNTLTNRVGIGVLNASARLHVAGSTSSLPVGIFQGASGQSTDILQVQDSSGNNLSSFNSAGQLIAGRTGASGLQGNVYFADGASSNTASLQVAGTLSGNVVYQLPVASAGTYGICTTAAVCSGYAASTGSGSYIQNTVSVQSANEYVQAATSGSVAATFRANAAGSGDILDLLNGSGTTVASFSSVGATLIKNSTNSATAFQIQPSGSAVPVLDVDTSSSRVGIGTATPGYTLDVVGDINASATLKVAGTTVCDTVGGTGCIAKSGSGFYIHNQTTTQSSNLNVQAATSGSVAGTFQANASGSGDILDLLNGSGTPIATFGSTGNVLLQASVNASAALQIQNANGNQGVTVDTTSSNLITTNSSFEAGTTTGWTAKGTGPPTLGTTTAQQVDGNRALTVATTTNANNGASYAVGMTSSTQYTFSFYARASGSNFSTLDFGRADNGSTDTNCSTGNQVLTTYWKRYTCTFTTGTVSGSPYVYFRASDSGNARTFYVDAVQLETGSAATPYRTVKTSIDGSLLINGGQLQAAASNWALQVNSLAGGNGLVINGNSDNNLFENALLVTHPDGTNLFTVNEVTHGTIINGGSSALSSAALTVNNIDPGSVVAKLTAISAQTADILQIINASGTVLSVGATGSTIYKTTTNSTSAFQLQNSSGASFLNVDNVNANITLDAGNAGQLAAWQTNTNSLPTSVGGNTAAAKNGYVYSAAGDDGVFTGKPYYAKLNASGSVGSWTQSANASSVVVNQTSVTLNGYMYLLGGANGGNLNTVQYAQLNADGSVGAFSTTTSLPVTVGLGMSVTANGYVYVIGGSQAGSVGRNVYYAKANSNGTLGSWTTVSNSLPVSNARESSAAVYANGYIYLMGGDDGTNTASTTYYASVNPSTGAIGSWSSGSTLPASLTGSSAVVVNGYIYLMGGNTVNLSADTTHMVSSVYYAKINANGSISSWATSTNSLPAPIEAQSSVTVNGYIYTFGGYTTGRTKSTAVYYTSTGRVTVNASLDLVGSTDSNATDGGDQTTGGSGGSLTAGNTNIVGSLQVQNEANFAGNLTVGKNASITGSLSIGPNGGDTNGSLLVLGNKTNSGDPTQVNGAIYYNSSSREFRCGNNGIWQSCLNGLAFSNTAPSTAINNTAAITNFTTDTNSASLGYGMLANDCQPGVTYLITASGLYSATTAQGFKMYLNYDDTAHSFLIGTGTFAPATTPTNFAWQFTSQLICDTSGTSGTVEAQGMFTYNSANTNSSALANIGGNTTTETINTTIAHTIYVGIKWPAAVNGNTSTLRQLIVQRLDPT